MARVSIIIEAKDRAQRAFRGARGQMRSLRLSIGNVVRSFAKLTAATGAAVFALTKLTQRGTEVTNIQNAFARATGDSEAAIGTLRRATRGLVSDLDLMQQFNQAVALGSARTAEEFGDLAEAALALGRSLGVDAKFALESLNLGIARQSRMILDNLGITVSVKEANDAYAASLDRTASSLSEAEQKEAFRLAVLRQAKQSVEEMGGVQDQAGDAATRFTSSMKNFMDEVAEMVAQSDNVASFFGVMERGLDTLAEKLPGIIDRLAELGSRGLEALGLSDPVARLADERLAGVRAGVAGRSPEGQRRGLNIERQNIEQRFGQLLARRGVLEAQLQQRGLLTDAGTIDPLTRVSVTETDTTGEATELIEEFEGLSQEMSILGRVIAGIRDMLGQLDRAAAGGGTGGDGGGGGGVAGAAGTALFGLRNRGAAAAALFEGQRRGMGVRQQEGPGALTAEGARGRVFAGLSPQAMLGASEAAITPIFDVIQEQSGHTAQVVTASMGAMAEAAILGSDRMEEALVGGISRILQSLPGVGGFASAAIGAVSGIVGAFISRNRRDPQPVRIDDLSQTAERKMRETRTGPDRVIVQVQQDGRTVEEIEYDLRRRSRRDARTRVPSSGSTVTTVGG